jgi:hypothetical protein
VAHIDVSRLPVRPDQKISTVLKEHPELLDVFVAQSPAFSRLKNPVMRRTFGRMVTVSQAAAVAGVPVDELLLALNEAAGVALDPTELAVALGTTDAGAGAPVAAHPGSADAARGTEAIMPTPVLGAMLGGAPPGPVGSDQPPAWLGQATVVADLDAREMQHRGEDPFFVIQDTARTVPPGEAFRVRNTFQPFPLYGVLGAKGFAHWVEELGPDDWLITFYRERQVSADTDADDTHPHGATRPEMMPSAADAVVGAVDAAPAAAAVPAATVDIEALFAADAPPAEGLVAAVVTITPDDLTPPIPMVKVLEGLAPLSPGDLLLVHHLRLPPHLTAKLEEQGHRYRVWDLGPDRKEILILKAAE